LMRPGGRRGSVRCSAAARALRAAGWHAPPRRQHRRPARGLRAQAAASVRQRVHVQTRRRRTHSPALRLRCFPRAQTVPIRALAAHAAHARTGGRASGVHWRRRAPPRQPAARCCARSTRQRNLPMCRKRGAELAGCPAHAGAAAARARRAQRPGAGGCGAAGASARAKRTPRNAPREDEHAGPGSCYVGPSRRPSIFWRYICRAARAAQADAWRRHRRQQF
jgi:hypothetical protein